MLLLLWPSSPVSRLGGGLSSSVQGGETMSELLEEETGELPPTAEELEELRKDDLNITLEEIHPGR